jgi:hypothetical protein
MTTLPTLECIERGCMNKILHDEGTRDYYLKGGLVLDSFERREEKL